MSNGTEWCRKVINLPSGNGWYQMLPNGPETCQMVWISCKKLFCLACYMRMTNKKWELSCHLVTKQSFRHFLNSTPNQKTSFIKVLQFGMLFENSTSKVKVKLSFGHKAVISSLSKLNIETKNLFYKSCSVWFALRECHIKSES